MNMRRLFAKGYFDFAAFTPPNGLASYSFVVVPAAAAADPNLHWGMYEAVRLFLNWTGLSAYGPVMVIDCLDERQTQNMMCTVASFEHPSTRKQIYLFLTRKLAVPGARPMEARYFRWIVRGYAHVWPQHSDHVVWLGEMSTPAAEASDVPRYEGFAISERSREALLIPPEVDPSVIAARLRENGVPEEMISDVFTPSLDGRALRDAHEYLMRTKGFDDRAAWAVLRGDSIP